MSWLDGYTRALGLAYGSLLLQRRREHELTELLEVERPPDAPELLGDDSQTQALRRDLLRIHIPAAAASHPFPMLVLGDKGTGKELIARFVHAYSRRRKGPFVAINCAELTEEMAAARFFGHVRGAFTDAHGDQPGLFRSADGGVLFLDEIGHLSVRAQATLLAVLENHLVQPVGSTKHIPADVMLVLATNRDIDDARVRESFLLEDFYDRIAVRTLRLSPLASRPWDVPVLAEHFRSQHERRMRRRTLGFSPDALRSLTHYAWPGNVRELSRVCDLLVSVTPPGERIDRAAIERHYPRVGPAPKGSPAPATLSQSPLCDATRAFQRQLILSRIEAYDGDTSLARKSLGLPWTTMRRYLSNLEIELPPRESSSSPA